MNFKNKTTYKEDIDFKNICLYKNVKGAASTRLFIISFILVYFIQFFFVYKLLWVSFIISFLTNHRSIYY